MWKQYDLLLGNGWVLHKVLKWYLPTHSVDLSSQGPYIWTWTRHSYTTFWTKIKKPIWFTTRKRLKFIQGSEMISPNSFCGFVFARAIDMNLDPPFLYNLLSKHENTNLIYYSETVEFYTRFWNDISQLILWICLQKAHRYDFRLAIPAKSSEQKLRNQLFDLLLGNGWILHKILKWYLPTHSVALSWQGP